MPLAEWVLAAYVGAAHTQPAPLSLNQPPRGTTVTLADVAYRGNSFQSPVYYGYRLTFFPGAQGVSGIEAELIHLKVYARTDREVRISGAYRGERINVTAPASRVLQRFAISHGLNLILVNATMRKAVEGHSGERRLEISARIGAGPTLPHPESVVDGSGHDGYQLGRLAVQAAGGLDVRVWRGLSIIAEYKFTRTAQRVAIDSGEARGTFASHHGVIGLAWHTR